MVIVVYYLYLPPPHLIPVTSVPSGSTNGLIAVNTTYLSTSTIPQNASQQNATFSPALLFAIGSQPYGLPNSAAFISYSSPYYAPGGNNSTYYYSTLYGLNFTGQIVAHRPPPLNSTLHIPSVYMNAKYPIAAQAIAVSHPSASAQEAYLNNLQYNSTYSNQSMYLFYNWAPSGGPAPDTVKILQNRTVSVLPSGAPFIEISSGPYYGKLEQSKLYFGLGNYTIIVSTLGISGQLNQSYIIRIANTIYNS
jgi:hypothetical protein